MNVHPALNIPMMAAMRLLFLGSITKTLFPGSTPFFINELAILLLFSFNSLYVNVASLATRAILSGFSATCFSKRSCKIGVSIGSNVGIPLFSLNSISPIDNFSISASIN